MLVGHEPGGPTILADGEGKIYCTLAKQRQVKKVERIGFHRVNERSVVR